MDNSSAPSVTRSYTLPAGQYTMVIGSNAVTDDVARQGYNATFSTVAVSEPNSALLGGMGALALLVRRRR